LGLVKGDTNVTFPEYDEDEIAGDYDLEGKRKPSPPRHGGVRVVAGDSPPRRSDRERWEDLSEDEQEKEKWKHPGGPPPPFDDKGRDEAVI
jgi:hypothetical protein